MVKATQKRLIGYIIAIVVFVLFLILTIVLLTAPVFNGKYTAVNSETKAKRELTFRGDKYTMVVYNYVEYPSYQWDTMETGYYSASSGYYFASSYNDTYKYTPINSSLVNSNSSTKNDLIDLYHVGSLNSGHMERQNVFKLVVLGQGHSDNVMVEGEVYICVGAIVLQVFYSVMMLAAIIALIIINKRFS